jgi:hypothetical protein
VVYDLTKSLLIDSFVLNLSQSLKVASLVSVSIEIQLNKIMGIKRSSELPSLSQLEDCNEVWNSLTKSMFGSKSEENLEMLGKYLFLR